MTSPPLTDEEIAAVLSNPLGVKQVRCQITCRPCGDSFRAYAGLVRDADLEKDGWKWSLSINDERFKCRCGTTEVPLCYVRSGLHGMLRQNASGRLGYAANMALNVTRLYEISSIEEHCRQFIKLLQSTPREEVVQKFLENHPIFLSVFSPRKLMVKKPVLTKYFVDFAVLNERKELVLIEIEKPSARLSKVDGGVTAELQHAIDQVRRWIRELENHRAAGLDAFGLKMDEVVKIRGAVIAGRTPPDGVSLDHIRSIDFGLIEIYTSDDLRKFVAQLVQHVNNA